MAYGKKLNLTIAGIMAPVALALALLLNTGMSPKVQKSVLPPGFTLVGGKDSIQPFLISDRPVSNFEYLLYMEWMRHVYQDYPEVYEHTKPASTDSSITFPLNDPYSHSYLGHPAYADYPVVGVNWEQAMDYCSWKTDRLNEAILIEKGGMHWDKNMKNTWGENNFQTEAFINRQFEFSEKASKNQQFFHYRKNKESGQWVLPDDYYTNLKANSPDIFPELMYGGRLPTEEEWEYFQNAGSVHKTEWFVGRSTKEWAAFLNISQGMMNNYGQFRKVRSKPEKPQVLREWMLDTFTRNMVKNNNLVQRLTGGAMGIADVEKQYFDQYGSLDTKDSLGRFGFRIFGWSPAGEAICANRYASLIYFVSCGYMLEKTPSFIDSVKNIYLSTHLDSFRQIHKSIYNYGTFRHSDWVLEYNRITLLIGGIEYSAYIPEYQSIATDLDYLTGPAYFQFNCRHLCSGCERPGGITRVTRNSNSRKAEGERNGQNDLGFRVLIPWYGNSVKKPVAW